VGHALACPGLFRIARDADGLRLDFMTAIGGIPSFEDLRKRATPVRFEDARLYVATLADTACATTAGPVPSRERQRAVALPKPKKPRATRKAQLEALKKESDLALRDQIQRLLALPPERRTHFLRKRIGLRMSCI
jgi:hypothetical protein